MINCKIKKLIFWLAVICLFLLNAEEPGCSDVLRLHVIANSDRAGDQELKLKVKSVIAKRVASDLEAAAVRSKNSAMEYIKENRDRYLKLAEDTIKENGHSYRVSATVGSYWFPIKVYGKQVYPEGEYDALRIIIGNGDGKNWWCVLYPSLCRIDETCYVSEETENDADTCNEEEYEFSFRFIEWLRDMW